MAETVVEQPKTIEQLQAEIEQLRQENERLAGAGHHDEARDKRNRTRWALVLVTLGAILVALAVPAVWLNRVVFDTDTWVATVAPLADDPAIQSAVADQASTAIIEGINAEKVITDLLPPDLDRFAPVLASSVDQAIRTQTLALVRSDRFSQLWSELNRRGHEAFMAAVQGREGIVSISDGVFTLDTGLLADQVKGALQQRGLGFVDRIPTSALSRRIVLYESPVLASAGPILDGLQSAAFYIPLLGLALAAGAFALAADRRRVALWLGVLLVVFTVLPLQAVFFGQYTVVSQLENLANIPSAAAQSAFDIIFAGFVTAERTLAFLGLLIWFAAVVAGPSKWAVALRSGLSRGIGGVAANMELGPVGAWVAPRKAGLRTVGFILGAVILLLLPAPRSVGEIVAIAVGILIWLLVVEFLGAAPVHEEVIAADALVVEGSVADEEAGAATTSDEAVAVVEATDEPVAAQAPPPDTA